MAKVKITDTILRDGHQSQAATRMRTDEMLPACEKLDKVGYFSLECWGGATYDACIRFLNEDPWERLRLLRKALPNTKLQMLLRGQNLLGYRPYSDDVVEFFVKKAVENGIDIIRCFDALNDLRNMQTAVHATKKYGGQGCDIFYDECLAFDAGIEPGSGGVLRLIPVGAADLLRKGKEDGDDGFCTGKPFFRGHVPGTDDAGLFVLRKEGVGSGTESDKGGIKKPDT